MPFIQALAPSMAAGLAFAGLSIGSLIDPVSSNTSALHQPTSAQAEQTEKATAPHPGSAMIAKRGTRTMEFEKQLLGQARLNPS